MACAGGDRPACYVGAEREGMAAMDEEAEFANHIEMQEYVERNGLDYAWSGTPLFAKRKRTLPPDQFEVM
jgi:hypothetical protein